MEQRKCILRKTIIQNNLLSMQDIVPISDRDFCIIKDYADGSSYKELSEKYSITIGRLNQIVEKYVAKCLLYKPIP